MSPSESNSTTVRFGCASARPSAKPGVAAHRRIAERHVERLVRGELHPVAAAAAGHDDRVAAVRGEYASAASAVCIMTRAPYRLKP